MSSSGEYTRFSTLNSKDRYLRQILRHNRHKRFDGCRSEIVSLVPTNQLNS